MKEQQPIKHMQTTWLKRLATSRKMTMVLRLIQMLRVIVVMRVNLLLIVVLTIFSAVLTRSYVWTRVLAPPADLIVERVKQRNLTSKRALCQKEVRIVEAETSPLRVVWILPLLKWKIRSGVPRTT